MFSEEESAQLRHSFWKSFGKSFPKKWLLYNTKIKGVALKFEANRKQASICLDLDHPAPLTNALLYQQLLSLKALLQDKLPYIIYDDNFRLDNGKTIKRLYLPYSQPFSIHNKSTWQGCYTFFVKNMTLLEGFFIEYQDLIKQVV